MVDISLLFSSLIIFSCDAYPKLYKFKEIQLENRGSHPHNKTLRYLKKVLKSKI